MPPPEEPPSETFLLFTRNLDSLGVRYMVSGSIAAIYYGEPRLTNDVDIIVFLTRADAARIPDAFPEEDFYCPPREVIEMEISRSQRGHFNVIHHASGFKADIYLSGKEALHAWGYASARQVKIGNDSVWLAPPEYVIVRKLQFYREGQSQKHLRDISRMLSSLGEGWDKTSLVDIIREQGLQVEWEKVLECDE